jgi:hypothetical protein
MDMLKPAVSAIVCLGGLVSLAMTSLVTRDQPTGSAVTAAAERLGITAECLAGLGVRESGVADVLDELSERMDQASALFAHESDLAAVTIQVEEAGRRLRIDAADEDAQVALANAQDQTASLRTTRDQAKESLLLEVFSGLADPDAVRRVLLNQHGAAGLPVAYRFAPESEDEAGRLSWALDASRLASARGEDAPSDATTLVTAAHGNVAVQTALLNVATHTPAIRTAIVQWQANR